MEHPCKKRIRDVKAMLKKAVRYPELSDSGLIRVAVAQSGEDSQSIVGRAENRYFRESRFGSPSVSGGFESVHGVIPEDGVVARNLRFLYPKMTRHMAQVWVSRIKVRINGIIDAADGEVTMAEAIEALQALEPKGVVSAILGFLDRVDEGADEIARMAANWSGGSLLLARHSRLLVDLNRVRNDRALLGRGALEFSLGGLEARRSLLLESLRMSGHLDSNQMLVAPYLLFGVHGKSSEDTADLVIGGRAGPNTSLLDPEIARWLKEMMDILIYEGNIRKTSGNLVSVGIAREGEQYSGEFSPAELRYGNEKYRGIGEMLQFVQLEVDRSMRGTLDARKVVAQLLADVLEAFGRTFCDAEVYALLIDLSRTKEDIRRLAGIYTVDTVRTPKLSPGKVALSARWRRVLNVKLGGYLVVGDHKYSVVQGFKEYARSMVLVFSDQDHIPDTVRVKSR